MASLEPQEAMAQTHTMIYVVCDRDGNPLAAFTDRTDMLEVSKEMRDADYYVTFKEGERGVMGMSYFSTGQRAA